MNVAVGTVQAAPVPRWPWWIALGLWLGIYGDTLWAMVELWWRSDTYAHGFVVYPLAVWLAWRRRDRLRRLPLAPSPWGTVALALTATAWLFGRVGGLLALEMLAWGLMLPALVLAVGGWVWLRALAFPLAFTLFAVPLGERLVPFFQDITAWFSVHLLRLSGIPVFWEDRFIHIPSGSFEVAEACSGVRYLYAALTFGALYAHLYLRGRRAWAFFALSALVPIVANGFRAYGIIMIAHLSDYTLAVGVDHYLYGWLFFGVVIALLLFIGERLRRGQGEETPPSHGTPEAAEEGRAAGRARLSWGLGLSLFLLAAPRVWAALAGGEEALAPTPHLAALQAPWSGPAPPQFQWRPFYRNADFMLAGAYRREAAVVEVHVVHYRDQTQDKELINALNRLDDERPWQKTWMRVGGGWATAPAPAPARVQETWLRYGTRQLLVWSWYRNAEGDQVSTLAMKWDEIRAHLAGRPAWADLIALAAPYEIEPEEARATLRRFLTEAGLPVRWEVTP